MTTIALSREGQWLVMACDGRVVQDTTIYAYRHSKVLRIKDTLLGFSGNLAQCESLVQWFKDGSPGRPPKHKGCTVLFAHKDGRALCLEDGGVFPVEIPTAIGSGSPHALTAMDLGCSARQAIQMAMLRDSGSGGDVQSLRMRIQ